jgi:hypothetical protein
MKKIKKPNYKGFCLHIEEWNKKGIPYGITDLIKLAETYHTPIPNIKKDNE